ncbi:MAG: MFS transporter [Candidatus Woesearchaeota archaeon]
MKPESYSYIVNIGYSAARILGWSFVVLYFLTKGYSNIEIAIFFTLTYLIAGLVTIFIKKLDNRKNVTLSLLLRILTFALLFVSHIPLYLIALIFGLFVPQFWLPLDILVYGKCKKHNTATKIGLYSTISPFLSLFVPIIGGYLIKYHGYPIVFIISILILALTLKFSVRLPDKKIQFDIRTALRKTRKTNILVFFEGMAGTASMITIPLVTLTFVSTAEGFGIFSAILSLFGIIASLLVAKNSDKSFERAPYIYLNSILVALCLVAAAFSSSLLAWTIAVCFMGFFQMIVAPLYAAVAFDNQKNPADTNQSRHVFLHFGRAVGGCIQAVSLLFNNFTLPLLLSAGITILYPILLSKLRIYKQSESLTQYLNNRSTNLWRTVAPTLYVIPGKHNDHLFYDCRYQKTKIK